MANDAMIARLNKERNEVKEIGRTAGKEAGMMAATSDLSINQMREIAWLDPSADVLEDTIRPILQDIDREDLFSCDDASGSGDSEAFAAGWYEGFQAAAEEAYDRAEAELEPA